jgi:hypothetical protein
MVFDQWFDKVSKMKLDASVLGADYYFIKEPNKTGYFAFVIPDWEYWGVEPGEDYESYDLGCTNWDDADKIWVHSGTKISPEELGKWRGIFCITEPVICDVNLNIAQEVWISFNGFWYDKPNTAGWLGHHYLDPESGTEISLRSEVASLMRLPEWALYLLSQELMAYNIGFSIVPSDGKIKTFEMENLAIAVGEAQRLVDSAVECVDLRPLGIGKKKNLVSSGGEVLELSDNWYETNRRLLNHAYTDTKDIWQAIESICSPSGSPLVAAPDNQDLGDLKQLAETTVRSGTRVKEMLSELEKTLAVQVPSMAPEDSVRADVAFAMVRKFLRSSEAQEMFTCMSDAGYGVALIPLGGRTIWSPSSS